jgi:hypothetical protein
VTVIDARRASAAQLREALGLAAQAGPFFRLELLDGLPASGWTSAAELYRTGLASAVERTARQLGTTEPRVAASILQLDVAARLWSPVLGCGVLRSVVPDLSSLLVSIEGPVRLGLAELGGWIARSPAELAALSADIVGRQLTALAAGLPVRLPAGLLRGNSASAMAGALGMLTSVAPGLAGSALAAGRALLATAGLRGAGELTGGAATGPAPGGPVSGGRDATALSFRRRSCCLYYRVPNAGLCGDCCLADRPQGRE